MSKARTGGVTPIMRMRTRTTLKRKKVGVTTLSPQTPSNSNTPTNSNPPSNALVCCPLNLAEAYPLFGQITVALDLQVG